MPGKLIIVCGLPGSGKTTHARRLERELNAIRLSADDWLEALFIALWDEEKRAQIEALQWQFAQRLLRAGLTVIIEWGTWGRSERDALRLRARELGATVELHYLSVSVEVLLQRIESRAMETPRITREQIQAWRDAFQTPTDEELALFDQGLTLKS
jgi:predicted kinase